MPDAYAPETIPEVGEIDELATFVGSKKQTLAVDSHESLQTRNFRGVLGDHSAQTFEPLWDLVGIVNLTVIIQKQAQSCLKRQVRSI